MDESTLIAGMARGEIGTPKAKAAPLFWLGECDDPRALETLIAIIKGK